MTPISESDVNAAQQAWCDALIRIGAVHAEGGDMLCPVCCRKSVLLVFDDCQKVPRFAS